MFNQKSLKRKLNKILIGVIGVMITTVSTENRGLAATFTLDFSTAPDGTVLDPYALDSAAGQTIGGTVYSTNNNNVEDIWESLGIFITGNRPTTEEVGLFNTECNPRGGFNDSGFTRLCEGETPGNTNGDNDLATGTGFNPQGETVGPNLEFPEFPDGRNYITQPQGNALIFEENAGDGNPDDDTNNGIITFDFDQNLLQVVKLGSIAVIDDINATLTITFRDGSTFVETLDINQENAVTFFGSGAPDSSNPLPIPQKNIDSFTVQLAAQGGTSSGAISGVVFSEFGDENQTPEIPESRSVISLVALGAVGLLLKATRKAKDIGN